MDYAFQYEQDDLKARVPNDKLLRKSHSNINPSEALKKSGSDFNKNDVRVSGSLQEVRLEADSN